MYHRSTKQLQKLHHMVGQSHSLKWQFQKLDGKHTRRIPKATFLASCRTISRLHEKGSGYSTAFNGLSLSREKSHQSKGDVRL